MRPRSYLRLSGFRRIEARPNKRIKKSRQCAVGWGPSAHLGYPADAPGRENSLSVAAVSDGLTALLQFSEHDFSWLAQFFSLWVLPLANEDLAIILGAYIVVNNIMPAGLVVLCIYGGMVASDFVLYGIGAGARHVPWLTRLAVDDRVRSFGGTLKGSLFGIVAVWRVVPGGDFVAFTR